MRFANAARSTDDHAHVGVLVIRSKLESLFETFVNIARLVQLIIGLAR
jgi:hypothetical protein